MEYKRLKDIAKITMGQSPDSSSYNNEKDGLPFFQGNADFGELYPNERFWCNAPKKVAMPGDILISVRAPIGALNYAKGKSCIGRGLAAITIENIVERNYIFHLLKARNNYLNSMGTGSTFKAIGKNVLEEILIPQISREEQQKCVNMMDLLGSIIRERQSQLGKFDEIIKARFVEMFGDPILNNKGFPVYKMEEVVDFKGGSQPDKKYFEYEPTENNVRLIQIRDYKTDRFITYIPKKMAKRFCNVDDIMIGRYGPPIFQILQGIEGSFNVALMKAIPKMGNIEFVRWFLKQDCLLRYLEGMSKRTAGQDGIQMDKLKEYPFLMPPIEMQNEFEQLVKQVNKSKLITYYHHKSIYTKSQLCCKMVIVNEFLNTKIF